MRVRFSPSSEAKFGIPAIGLLAALSIGIGGLGACGGTQPPVSPGETAKNPGMTNSVDYPKGPYGYTQGSIIENLQLTGQVDSNSDGLITPQDVIKPLHLSDYYQDKTIKAMFIGVAAGWCGPCKAEQPNLVALYNSYGGRKGKVAFLEAIIENADHQPADMTFVDTWATTYKIPFDMASDPTSALGPYYNQAAFPMQMIIKMSDMSIVWQQNGAPVEEVKTQIDAVLAGM